jgi:hypothetical protein
LHQFTGSRQLAETDGSDKDLLQQRPRGYGTGSIVAILCTGETPTDEPPTAGTRNTSLGGFTSKPKFLKHI